MLSTASICYILKVASRMLMAPKVPATPATSAIQANKYQSPERVSSFQLSEQHQHGTGYSPVHESRARRKIPNVTFNLSPPSGQPLPANVMREHTFVAQMVLNIVGAMLPTQVFT